MTKKKKCSFEIERNWYLEIVVNEVGNIIFNNVDKNSLEVVRKVSKLDSQDISYFCG